MSKPLTKVLTTYTGKTVDPYNVKARDIDPIDIAHALSNLCRYNGHVSQFYSVAQHSCLIADKIDENLKKQALFHDAAEAYVGDVITAIKHTEAFEVYRDLEDEVMLAICERFDLPLTFDPQVKGFDLAIREAEFRDLKTGYGSRIKISAGDIFGQIIGWSPKVAKRSMILRMKRLGVEVEDE